MITDLRLQHFRSYQDTTFEFGSGVNIIVGPNASGKTNLLEAILMICRGKSYRGPDQELLAFESSWARIDAHANNKVRTCKLVLRESVVPKKEFELDTGSLKRLLLTKQIPVVLFEPNHLLMLQGAPELRRSYLDNLLEQLVVGYGKLLHDYRRAVSQRNSLLKHGLGGSGQIFVWNLKLSETGGKIADHRIALVSRLGSRLNAIYQTLAGSQAPQIVLSYESSSSQADYASSLLKLLEARTDIDSQRGFTSVGPHRDDLSVTFNGRPATGVTSRGETRTVLLALKILELEIVEEGRNKKPLLLLDDVFSELDGARRQALTKAIKGYQAFITTTDADLVIQHFMDQYCIIPLGSQ